LGQGRPDATNAVPCFEQIISTELSLLEEIQHRLVDDRTESLPVTASMDQC
jgi:hypothetical protein